MAYGFNEDKSKAEVNVNLLDFNKKSAQVSFIFQNPDSTREKTETISANKLFNGKGLYQIILPITTILRAAVVNNSISPTTASLYVEANGTRIFSTQLGHNIEGLANIGSIDLTKNYPISEDTYQTISFLLVADDSTQLTFTVRLNATSPDLQYTNFATIGFSIYSIKLIAG